MIKDARMKSKVCPKMRTIENRNSSQLDLGQSVLRGYKRRVMGFNGRATAQPCQAPGVDAIFPVTPCYAGRWRVTGTEARSDHVPAGATFAGRQDPAVPWEESIPGKERTAIATVD